jgi:hypothetical protein
VVQLQQHSQLSEFVPGQVLEEGLFSSQLKQQGLGAVRVLGDGYVGVLQQHGQLIQVLDLNKGGAKSGKIRLPEGRNATSFCAGGGYLYFLGEGPSPPVFRVPQPPQLESMEMAEVESAQT